MLGPGRAVPSAHCSADGVLKQAATSRARRALLISSAMTAPLDLPLWASLARHTGNNAVLWTNNWAIAIAFRYKLDETPGQG